MLWWASWAAVYLGCVLVLGFLNDGVLTYAYRGDRSGSWIAIGIVAATALGAIGLLAIRRPSQGLGVLALGVVILAGAAAYGVEVRSKDLHLQVQYYCAYAAQSKQEYLSCVDTTMPGQVVYDESAAGLFARGEADCGPDAGPYCEDAAEERYWREAAAEARRY